MRTWAQAPAICSEDFWHNDTTQTMDERYQNPVYQ